MNVLLELMDVLTMLIALTLKEVMNVLVILDTLEMELTAQVSLVKVILSTMECQKYLHKLTIK